MYKSKKELLDERKPEDMKLTNEKHRLKSVD